eukprot:417555-Amphidinium_carterae.1
MEEVWELYLKTAGTEPEAECSGAGVTQPSAKHGFNGEHSVSVCPPNLLVRLVAAMDVRDAMNLA